MGVRWISSPESHSVANSDMHEEDLRGLKRSTRDGGTLVGRIYNIKSILLLLLAEGRGLTTPRHCHASVSPLHLKPSDAHKNT